MITESPPAAAATSPLQFEVGDTTVDYQIDEATGLIGLRLYPTDLESDLTPRREWIVDFEHRAMNGAGPKMRAAPVDSLVQVKCVGDPYSTGFAQGVSLRNSGTTLALKFESQSVQEDFDRTTVVTTLRDECGRTAEHHLSWPGDEPVFTVHTVFANESESPVTLELLSSFSLGDLTPFHPADAPERLRVHRLRSTWSAEGRLTTQSVEELNLERSWQDHAVRCERFGQVGSMPVRGFFPFAAIEDAEAGVCWGAQLAWAGSWQMEIYRQCDSLSFSGGLADREFGHWMKTLAPGESLQTPPATMACIAGDLDALCHRLTTAQVAAAEDQPDGEDDLPIIANDFCTTWGNPTHDGLRAIAERLQGSPVRYLVIDAGWYDDPGSFWATSHGDWIPSQQRFPLGLAHTSKMIRDHGLIPGLWFEFEVAAVNSAAFGMVDHQLRRDGVAITTSDRHFWDFRDPWVHDYLAERVIERLRAGGFGYAKFDYNETIGIGVDGAESLGEGLRQHIEQVGKFYDRIRAELPDLVIESCSSGGHRLEPSMVGRAAMSSFSDAHESLEVPIIAANLHRVILPRQSQIWAVLRVGDDAQRLTYSLAATFLGRMCLSGDIYDLTSDQWALTRRAMDFYGRIAPILRSGRSTRFGEAVRSYRHPEGWQALLRVADHGAEALLVAHSFADVEASRSISVNLPAGRWKVAESMVTGARTPRVIDGTVSWQFCGAYDAAVIHLQRI